MGAASAGSWGFAGRAARTVSVDEVGVSSGMLVEDRARCTVGEAWPGAAAVVELDRLEPRLGLASALLLRVLKEGLAVVPAPDGVALRLCGRGEASRDDSGEGELVAWNRRWPAEFWPMGGADVSLAMSAVESSRVVDVVGSALSSTPVKDSKALSSSAAVDLDEAIMDVLLLQWAKALVASRAGSGLDNSAARYE